MTSINLFFVRHGFAQHNEKPSIENSEPYMIEDPTLTDLGISQSKYLKLKLNIQNHSF